ncbi:MAG TPA: CPBP family intramembrane glutamic endopeptidase [Candidatus Sulfopaludibacter sp.]|nr:CPBP family intramembrane glutamic endopeptidase [Candidatus Sulfopaludibacter sp.]
MANTLGGFRAAALIGWIALSGVGIVFARSKGIPLHTALPVIAAFLAEYPFYLVAGFPNTRERLAGPSLPVWLICSAILPYLICCCGGIPFEWIALVRLLALAVAVSLWYVILPVNPVVDGAFLILIAAVMVGRYFSAIYPDVYKQHIDFLGHLALFHMAILVLILERRMPETGFGFIPSWKEWQIGFANFLWFLPFATILAVLLHATHFVNPRIPWAVATFVGFLFILGLTEEFFFRGVLQRWVEEWTWNATAALVITSILFGLVHYWFRGWRWVPIAAVMGFFCGRARNQADSIKASAVTHALVVATWRAFLW